MSGTSKPDTKTTYVPIVSVHRLSSSYSPRSDDARISAHEEASHVFWFCMRQLRLDGDVLSADFHPEWQEQQHAWPTFVQQVQRRQRAIQAC
jgi:hypothetical protein